MDFLVNFVYGMLKRIYLSFCTILLKNIYLVYFVMILGKWFIFMLKKWLISSMYFDCQKINDAILHMRIIYPGSLGKEQKKNLACNSHNFPLPYIAVENYFIIRAVFILNLYLISMLCSCWIICFYIYCLHFFTLSFIFCLSAAAFI